MKSISVSMLPAFVEQVDLTRKVVVVIDVLRASTTILHALANGARSIIPSESVSQARKIADQCDPNSRLLGGERNCQRIDGFDLDNSPFSFRSELVNNKDVIFTTTNGTFALQQCREADRVLIGAFNNLSSLVDVLVKDSRSVHLVCAGTNRQLTAEDILFAGAVVDRMGTILNSKLELVDVQAQMARDYFLARSATPSLFRKAFFESLGAQNLIRLGLERDIERAMEIDRFKIVPEWRATENRISVPAEKP